MLINSNKHNDELQYAQVVEIENMIASNEIETKRGANQIGNLRRAELLGGDLIFNLFVAG